MYHSINKIIPPFVVTVFIMFWCSADAQQAVPTISDATDECLGCHSSITPGIVADWERSRHAKITPAAAVQKPAAERRVSAGEIPDHLTGVVVGCAECHTLSPSAHQDNFNHAEYPVHTVVSPPDCAVCHPAEWDQYSENLMSHANINLTKNPLYQSLVKVINGIHRLEGDSMAIADPDSLTDMASCLYCHGTEVTVSGLAERETDLGEMEFPVLIGWPNQGVGRINPDGSVGSCTPCHARHQFSIELARKPSTCSQCHKGPDVPAYKVYLVSKHGNIFSAIGSKWDFDNVPWTVGEDFSAPTCAVCHVSLLVDGDGETITERTHRMNDRLEQRIFGLAYAHPHPVSPNTSIIKNKAGLPLPTELTGEPAREFLIGDDQQALRLENMKTVCRSCHSSQWTDNHFQILHRTVETTNEMTLTATRLMGKIWDEGLARSENLFDEAIERKWAEQWLFYANSTRFAAAMSGADYGVFAEGRWHLSKNIGEMAVWLEVHRALKK